MDCLGVDPGGAYRVVSLEAQIQCMLHAYWPYEVRAGRLAWAVRQAETALERWLSLGLPCRREGGKLLFDCYEASNFLTWRGLSHGDPVYEQHALPSTRRQLVEFFGTGPAPPGCGRHGRARFRVRLRREFNLRGQSLGRVLRLRVPRPFEDRTLEQVSVKLLEPAPATVRVSEMPGRLEVTLPPGERPECAAVEVEVRFTSYCESFQVEPGRLEAWDTSTPEYQLYTRRAEGLIRVTDAVAQLAWSLSTSAANAWEAVHAFRNFLFTRLKFGCIHHGELDPADPLGSALRRGWSDCYVGSALMAALCRARGIPARVVNGFQLYRGLPGNHYWLEVLLPPYGWVPVDVSWLPAAGSLESPPWSDYFMGRLDHRMKTQRLPHLAIGIPGVRVTPAWYMLTSLTAQGVQTEMYDLQTRSLLYRDRVEVQRDPPDEGQDVPDAPPTA